MAESQRNSSVQNNEKSDVEMLAEQLDGSNAQKAEAISQFVDSRIGTAMQSNSDRIEELIRQQRVNLEEVAVVLPQDRSQAVVDQVNDASNEVLEAGKGSNSLIERQNSGEVVQPEEIEQVCEKIEQAEQAVLGAKSAVEQQLADLRSQTDRHQDILAAEYDGERPPSRLDGMQANISSLLARTDQLDACQQELRVVSATAFASAEVGNDIHGMRRSAMAAGAAFAATFVVYSALCLLGIAEWDWNWAIGLPAVMAGIAGLIVWALTRPEGPSATSVASANSIVERWERSDRASYQNSVRTRVHQESPVLPLSILGDENDLDEGNRAEASASARVRQSVR